MEFAAWDDALVELVGDWKRHLSVSPFVCPFVCLAICLFSCVPVSVCLYVRLWLPLWPLCLATCYRSGTWRA